MATLQQKRTRLAYVFLTPALAALLVVGLYPLLRTVWLSFTNAERDFGPPQFNGLSNYRELFSGGEFLQSVLNTIVFTISSVGIELLLGLALALVINSGFRGRGMVRAAVLIPWALPTVVSARMWGWMLNDQYGVVNDVLFTQLGILSRPLAWTGEGGLAMASIVAVDVWKTTPFMALLILAGLQLIPGSLYEAAEVDGASARQQFLCITLPMLKPAILVALVFRTLDALRVFDVVWVMTQGQFGTESMATYTYRQLMSFGRLGYGSAASVAIFLIIGVFIAGYVALLGGDDE